MGLEARSPARMRRCNVHAVSARYRPSGASAASSGTPRITASPRAPPAPRRARSCPRPRGTPARGPRSRAGRRRRWRQRPPRPWPGTRPGSASPGRRKRRRRSGRGRRDAVHAVHEVERVDEADEPDAASPPRRQRPRCGQGSTVRRPSGPRPAVRQSARRRSRRWRPARSAAGGRSPPRSSAKPMAAKTATATANVMPRARASSTTTSPAAIGAPPPRGVGTLCDDRPFGMSMAVRRSSGISTARSR